MGEGGVDRRGSQSCPLHEQVGGEEGVLLQKLVNAERGAGSVALCRYELSAALEQLDDSRRRIKCLIGRFGNARKKERLARPVSESCFEAWSSRSIAQRQVRPDMSRAKLKERKPQTAAGRQT